MTLRHLIGVAVMALALVVTASVPAHADDAQPWTSIYEGTPYEGSGWSNCPAPITVSVDARALKRDQRKKAKAALVRAINRWNRAGLVTFQYVGPIPVTFSRTTGVTAPVDGQPRDRHIYVAVVKAKGDNGVDKGVVGLATPLRVDPATKTILEGSAAFKAAYINKQSRPRVAELFAHELGHVFGLGHSSAKKDVMYPILQGHTDLGPGDIDGAFALLKPCPAPAPEPVPAA
jgi:hypothetical protein